MEFGVILFILLCTASSILAKNIDNQLELSLPQIGILSAHSENDENQLSKNSQDIKVAQAKVSIISAENQTELCRTIHLESGWNIFSSPVVLSTADIKVNFQNLIDDGSLVKIQDEAGWSLENRGIFGGWVNDIGDIIPTEGYKIKVNSGVNIQFCGLQVEYPYSIPLSIGWNIIGYPGTDTISAMDFVQELIDKGNLVKMQDEKGNSIEDLGTYGGWQNFIGNVFPGEGYSIKVLASDTLWVYDNYTDTTQTPKTPGLGFSVVTNSLSSKSGQEYNSEFITKSVMAETTHFKTNRGNGVDHMNFNLVELPFNLLNVGDEIAVYDGMTCVGATKIDKQHVKNDIIQISASSSDADGMQGFQEGNEYKIRIWSAEKDQEREISFRHISGEMLFAKHESVLLSLVKGNELNNESKELVDFDLICFPNPFEEHLTVQFNLMNDSRVSISIFDQLGQNVSNIVDNKTLSKGYHQFSWDGKGNSHQKISTGIYFLQISVDEEIFNKKIILKH